MRAIGVWLVLISVLLHRPATAQEIALPTVTFTTTTIAPQPTTAAMGTADLRLNPSTRQLTWQIVVNGMTSAPVAIQLERIAAAGPQPAINLTPDGAEEPLRGSVTLGAAEAAELLAGRYAIVLRTPAYLGGELRGVIMPP
jgi:hypothetical protein